MTHCDFANSSAGAACSACGYQLRRDYKSPPIRRCKSSATYITLLGRDKYLWQCRACNWTLEADTPEPVIHRCGTSGHVKLGDKIEHALTSAGITKERWIAVKESLHLPPLCNCDARREWLNNAGDALGDAAHKALRRLFGEKD